MAWAGRGCSCATEVATKASTAPEVTTALTSPSAAWSAMRQMRPSRSGTAASSLPITFTTRASAATGPPCGSCSIVGWAGGSSSSRGSTHRAPRGWWSHPGRLPPNSTPSRSTVSRPTTRSSPSMHPGSSWSSRPGGISTAIDGQFLGFIASANADTWAGEPFQPSSRCPRPSSRSARLPDVTSPWTYGSAHSRRPRDLAGGVRRRRGSRDAFDDGDRTSRLRDGARRVLRLQRSVRRARHDGSRLPVHAGAGSLRYRHERRGPDPVGVDRCVGHVRRHGEHGYVVAAGDLRPCPGVMTSPRTAWRGGAAHRRNVI